MKPENILEPLHTLLTQAQALLVFAQAENWSEFQTAFEHYQQNIFLLSDAAYIQTIQNENLSAEAQDFILQIQTINQQLDTLAEKTHANIASELRQILQSDKALNAYRR
jgi:hypothetical protein